MSDIQFVLRSIMLGKRANTQKSPNEVKVMELFGHFHAITICRKANACKNQKAKILLIWSFLLL